MLRAKRPITFIEIRNNVKVNDSGCWEWQGSINKRTGYGHVLQDMAHRVVWEKFNGPIPEGCVIDHVCVNRRCVNPTSEHTEAVTQAENLRRSRELHPQPTHCKAGHEYTPENTISGRQQGKNFRRCVICRKTQLHEHYLRTREDQIARQKARRLARK